MGRDGIIKKEKEINRARASYKKKSTVHHSIYRPEYGQAIL